MERTFTRRRWLGLAAATGAGLATLRLAGTARACGEAAVRVRTDREAYAPGDELVATVENAGDATIHGSDWSCGGLRFERETADGWADTGRPVLLVMGRQACVPLIVRVEAGKARELLVPVQVDPGRYRLRFTYGFERSAERGAAFSPPFAVRDGDG